MDEKVAGRALRVRCIYGMCLRKTSDKGVSLGHTSNWTYDSTMRTLFVSFLH